MKRALLLLVSHGVAAAAGFALGVYLLPVLVAPPAPAADAVAAAKSAALYQGEFRRDLPGSDALHWGEGRVYVGRDSITFEGELAPGPDYKLYLSPEYVETIEEFERARPNMLRVGDVKTFGGFLVPLPAGVDVAAFNSVVVWCETFSMFITAARYR